MKLRLALPFAVVFSVSIAAQVTFERLLRTSAEPGNWLSTRATCNPAPLPARRRSRRPT